MNPHRKLILSAILLLLIASPAIAGDKDKPAKISDQTRVMIIRTFNAELVFARSYFPMGKVGIKIDENGTVSPNAQQLRQLIADSGPAAKPGDRVKITNVIFKGNAIIFEINGGPVKKKKWYERISVDSIGGSAAPMDKSGDPTSLDVNSRGSYVAITFKDYVPEINAQGIKSILKPVLDFNATNAAQAYAESLPPIVQQALKNHKALVGMDRDMVVYALGRAPRKIRDRDGTTDYEEWIYGQPPQEVQFIRFVGDRVVRIETMKVNGEKEVRTAKEIDLDQGRAETVAKKQGGASDEDKKGPSLLRPGEQTITANPSAPDRSAPMGGQQGPQPSSPGQPPMGAPDPSGAPPSLPGPPGGTMGGPPH